LLEQPLLSGLSYISPGADVMAEEAHLSPANDRTSPDQEGARAVSQTAASFLAAIIDTIEHQPYTAIAIAFGIGWFFGRLHRPF
jgi:ElaB/YqjD/DUF883 family membrane-anchored ribosome-binding protein